MCVYTYICIHIYIYTYLCRICLCFFIHVLTKLTHRRGTALGPLGPQTTPHAPVPHPRAALPAVEPWCWVLGHLGRMYISLLCMCIDAYT